MPFRHKRLLFTRGRGPKMLEVNIYITSEPNFGDDRPVTVYRGA